MREIKFRAWVTYIAVHPYMATQGDKEIETLGRFVHAYVHDDTQKDGLVRLMQYTGLKDKNGVEIYEGDLIKEYGGAKPSEIIFGWGLDNEQYMQSYGWCTKSQLEKEAQIFGANPEDLEKEWEVIGNIYENPELLGKKSSNV